MKSAASGDIWWTTLNINTYTSRMPIACIILLITLLIIAVRQWLPWPIKIWQVSGVGAIAEILCQQISVKHAIMAVNYEIIVYLFAVFLLAAALEKSGYLSHLAVRLFNHAGNASRLLFMTVFVMGLASAVLMNDTVAIIATPLIIQMTKQHSQLRTPLLLALAYAITIGSVLSPLGNPQNLLISLHTQLFIVPFLHHLALPTLINLLLCYFTIRLCFNTAFTTSFQHLNDKSSLNPRLTKLAKRSLALFLLLIIANLFFSLLPINLHLDFATMALIATCPIILFANARIKLLKMIDWGTIVFFISLFILVQSVWQTGYLQSQIQHWHVNLRHLLTIFTSSILLSQIISNVPLVALYLPLLDHLHALPLHYLGLAAASTIAGNAFIFGAASNIIILHNSEQRQAHAFGFWQFSLIGIPLCLVNLLVYYLFLCFIVVI